MADASNEVILAEIQHIRQDVSEIKDMQRKMNGSVRLHDQCLATLEERWKHHDREHSALKTKKNLGDVAAAIAGAIAGSAASWLK